MEYETVAVLSDIHGNARALDAVLAEIARRGVRRIVHLGDCLYGPFDPRPVAERLMELGIPGVSGNEDRVLLDQEPKSKAARFTQAQLGAHHLAWLASLPRTMEFGTALLCHGTPTDDTTTSWRESVAVCSRRAVARRSTRSWAASSSDSSSAATITHRAS
jgi:predicted phosphodiesterase